MTITETSPAPVTDRERSVLVDAATGKPIRSADIVGSTVELVVRGGAAKRKALVRGLGSGLLIVSGRWPFGDGVFWRDYVPVADIVAGSRVITDTPRAAVMTVTVRDAVTEARRWGAGPGGVALRTVTIAATCPLCGRPRGAVRGLNSCSDGEYFHVNVWVNPCGHVDMYESVLVEAGVHPPAHLRAVA